MTKFSDQAIAQLSAHLDEPEWMRALRRQAWELYNSTPLPSTDDEAWRRTSLRRLPLQQFGPSLNGAAASFPEPLAAEFSEAEASGRLAQVGGVTAQPVYVSEAAQSLGVIFGDMSWAVREHGELVRPHFMTEAVPVTEGKFAALHGAFWRGGTFLYVPRGVRLEIPFRSWMWSRGQSYTHTLVIVDEGAEATLIEEYASAPDEQPGLHNGVVELLLRQGARLHYVSLQDFADNVWQFTHERARVGRDGHLDWVLSVMGTRLTKSFQTIDLDEQGAFARLSGLFFGDNRQHFDLDTQQNHNAPDTVSDLLYKGALRDRARSVWQGMIKALPGAQRIDGFQANRNLVLERTASVKQVVPTETAPGWLEIELDDLGNGSSSSNHLSRNGILEVLIRAEIPIVGFEVVGGRLQDVFLQLTAEVIE